MKNNWFGLGDFDDGSSYNFPLEPLIFHSFGGHVFSHISSFMGNSLHHCRYFHVPGSLALDGAYNHISKFAGAILVMFSSGTSTNATRAIAGNLDGCEPGSSSSSARVQHNTSSRQKFKGLHFRFGSKGDSNNPMDFGKILASVKQFLQREAERQNSYSLLSLATALIPPFGNLSSNMLAVSSTNTDVLDQRPCEVGRQGCAGLPFPDLDWRKHAVEPRTGIEFPMVLDNILKAGKNSSLSSEVLVGTGSRTMTIIRIKSLKLYAFGFYIHPYSVCKKLGQKYGSLSVDELKKRHDFYQDLLSEDIDMTVRLVVSCNGLKVNTVRDAFEKSLRARLVKTNPETDYRFITTFGSNFTQDIPLPAGTTIDFQRTADGKLITKTLKLEIIKSGLSKARNCAGRSLTCTWEMVLCQSKQKKRLAEILLVSSGVAELAHFCPLPHIFKGQVVCLGDELLTTAKMSLPKSITRHKRAHFILGLLGGDHSLTILQFFAAVTWGFTGNPYQFSIVILAK